MLICIVYSYDFLSVKSVNTMLDNKDNISISSSDEDDKKSAPSLAQKVIVIDAGHGGYDEGAIPADGKYCEKDYTLFVTKELKKLLDKTEAEVYYTRLEDKAVSKKDRTKLANKLKADVFISIHCNILGNGNSSISGVEALYSKRKSGNEKLTNKKLAAILAENVSDMMETENRGAKQREDLYLMHHSNVPTSIIEIGYMSNKSDFAYIKSKEGRKKIAQSIYNAIEQALS